MNITPNEQQLDEERTVIGPALRKVSLKQLGFYAVQALQNGAIEAGYVARDITVKLGFKDAELYRAAAKNELKAVATLLAEGVHPSAPNAATKGWTPLFSSAEAHSHEVTRVLLNATIRKDPDLIDHRDKVNFDTLLHVSARAENWDTYTKALSHRPHPDAMNIENITPAMMVAAVGSVDVLKATFKGGADPLQLDNDGLPLAVHVVAGQSSDNEKIAKLSLLKENGLDFNRKYGADQRTLLSFGCEHATEAVVKFLIAQPGVNVDAESKMKLAPMHYGVMNSPEIVVALLGANAQANVYSRAQPEKGLIAATPLMLAAGHNKLEAAFRLCDDKRTNLSLTVPGTNQDAASIASSRGHDEVASMIKASALRQIQQERGASLPSAQVRALAAQSAIDAAERKTPRKTM